MAERLVHQEHIRIAAIRSGDADALLHTAGELDGKALFKACEADQINELLRDLGTLLFGDLFDLLAEGDIVHDRHPGEQGHRLIHHGSRRFRHFNGFAVVENRAVAGFQTGQHIEQRGLAALTRPEDDEKFVFIYIERQIAKHLEIALRRFEGLAESFAGQLYFP